MPHVTRTIELSKPVDAIHEQWIRFEDLPSAAVQQLVAHVHWRAEVLTLEPVERGTRLTLKIEYVPDPVDGDSGLPRRMERVLRSFAAFVEGRPALARASAGA